MSPLAHGRRLSTTMNTFRTLSLLTLALLGCTSVGPDPGRPRKTADAADQPLRN